MSLLFLFKQKANLTQKVCFVRTKSCNKNNTGWVHCLSELLSSVEIFSTFDMDSSHSAPDYYYGYYHYYDSRELLYQSRSYYHHYYRQDSASLCWCNTWNKMNGYALESTCIFELTLVYHWSNLSYAQCFPPLSLKRASSSSSSLYSYSSSSSAIRKRIQSY